MADDIRDYLFVQAVSYNGQLIDPGALVSADYIEVMDLSGPKLILTYNDRFSYIRDDMGVDEEAVLQVSLADFSQLDRIYENARFTVVSIQEEGDHLILNCLLTDLHELKRPAPRTRMFVRKSAVFILRQLLPGFRIEADGFPVLGDYHLLAGDTPSRFLRRLALEHGAALWVCRGTVYFKAISRLLSTPVKRLENVYEHGNFAGRYQLRGVRPLAGKRIYQERAQRQLVGWSMTGGSKKSRMHRTGPIRLYSHHNPTVLQNLTAHLVPFIECDCLGNGELQAGLVVPTVFHRNDAVSVLNEAMPQEILVGLVSHHSDKKSYTCLIEGWRPQQ